MRKLIDFILLSVFLLSFQMNGYGQVCATDYIHQQLMVTDSNYRKQILNIESQVEAIFHSQENEKIQDSVFTIPVVVHVVHVGEPVGTGTNISDSIIYLAIDGLNNRFRNITGSGVDVEIEFCLANRDPSGNPTSGINRANGAILPNYQAHGISVIYNNCDAPSEQAVKDLSKWPTNEYYNVWVVNMLCQGFGGFAGYASYPNGSPYDGTIINAYYMNAASYILTHELGHGFFLYHTFNGDGGNVICPVDTACLVNGDFICDTPPHKQWDCGATNPCSGTGVWANSLFNHMSYCAITNRFTSGQKTRMRATAMAPPRKSLLISNGCSHTIPVPEIPEDEANSLIITPNPATNDFTIKFNQSFSGKGAIQIFNILGEKVFEDNYFYASKELTVNFNAGIYFVQLGLASKKFVKKIIILNN